MVWFRLGAYADLLWRKPPMIKQWNYSYILGPDSLDIVSYIKLYDALEYLLKRRTKNEPRLAKALVVTVVWLLIG